MVTYQQIKKYLLQFLDKQWFLIKSNEENDLPRLLISGIRSNMWEKWQVCDAIITVIQPLCHRRLPFLILSKITPMEAHFLVGLLSQTQTVVVDSRGFSCDTKRHLWRDLSEAGWLQSQHFCLLAHLLLLDIQHSVVDGDKDVLRVHVVHQTTGREDLQDTLYEGRRRQSVFKVCQI